MPQYSRVEISCTYFLQSTRVEYPSSNSKNVTQNSSSGNHVKLGSNPRRPLHFMERFSPTVSSSYNHAARQHSSSIERKDDDDAELRHDAGVLPPMAQSQSYDGLGLLVDFLRDTKEANNMILSERIRTSAIITDKAGVAAVVDGTDTPSNRAKRARLAPAGSS